MIKCLNFILIHIVVDMTDKSTTLNGKQTEHTTGRTSDGQYAKGEPMMTAILLVFQLMMIVGKKL